MCFVCYFSLLPFHFSNFLSSSSLLQMCSTAVSVGQIASCCSLFQLDQQTSLHKNAHRHIHTHTHVLPYTMFNSVLKCLAISCYHVYEIYSHIVAIVYKCTLGFFAVFSHTLTSTRPQSSLLLHSELCRGWPTFSTVVNYDSGATTTAACTSYTHTGRCLPTHTPLCNTQHSSRWPRLLVAGCGSRQCTHTHTRAAP